MIGDRVGAIVSADQKQVKFLGYGILVEEEVPRGIKGMGEILSARGETNLTILLDSGKKVYGCECWWGPEAKIREMIGDREVVMVTPEAMRAGE